MSYSKQGLTAHNLGGSNMVTETALKHLSQFVSCRQAQLTSNAILRKYIGPQGHLLPIIGGHKCLP